MEGLVEGDHIRFSLITCPISIYIKTGQIWPVCLVVPHNSGKSQQPPTSPVRGIAMDWLGLFWP